MSPSFRLLSMATAVVLSNTFTASFVSAQNNLKEIPPTDPAEEMATFKLAEGMEINLFASEPMVAKPIQMAWDKRGRLWVASSAIYPHIKPGQTEADKILILEDTDHDGKADKSTVFFEGLLIPTGIFPVEGGVYVANSTELLFMSDTDGDGKADTREVLLSGFGTEDTHHILHSIRGGPDGNIYMTQSVYIHSHVETAFGVRRLLGSGIWQYHPDSRRLEVFSMGQINPWGHSFDRWGQSFTTDGAYGEGINYNFPGATFRCLPNQLPKILKGLNPGQPKQAGLEIINSRQFPADWQGNMITNDFRGHRINRFAVSEEGGSGFTSRQLPDLVSSSHGSFRPVDINTGPDGALYVADWYNPIIQHGEVDFHDARRDRVHGRIWRITAKGGEKTPLVNFAKLTEGELFEQLKAPEFMLRYWAKQEIKTRKIPNLTDKLAAFLEKNSSEPQLIAEAMWTAQTSGLADFALVSKILQREPGDPHLRAAAVRVMRQLILTKGLAAITNSKGEALSLTEIEKIWSLLANDDNARVRLEAVNMLRTAATPRAVEIACEILDHPMDANLDFALWLTCYNLAHVWFPALQAGQIAFNANSARLQFALKAADKPDAAGLLLGIVKENKLSAENAAKLLEIIGSTGRKQEINELLVMAADKSHPAALRKAACQAMITAQQQRQIVPDQAEEVIIGLLAAPADESLPAALQLAGLWKIEGTRPLLEKLTSSADRLAATAAMQSLASLGGEASQKFLQQMLGQQQQPEGKANVLIALIALDIRAATPLVVDFLGSLKESTPSAETLIQAYLNRNDGPDVMAQALADKKLAPAIASKALQKTSATAGNTAALMAALTKAGGLTPVLKPDAEEMKKLMQEVTSTGDAARGELIYRQPALQCMVCHAIGPVGGIVGPNLVSIGSSAPVDYIIDSLLEPAKKIKEGYATAMVQTKDGTTHTGFLSRQDDKEILLRDAAGNMQSIPMSSVTKQETIPISLMPAGLTAGLRRDELIDLVRFLSELGKEGGYKVQEDGTLRQWFFRNSEKDASMTTPVSSLTNGTLPLKEISPIMIAGKKMLAVQSIIEVTLPGLVTVTMTESANVTLEVNDQKLALQKGRGQTELKTGKHLVKLLIPADTIEAIKVQLLSTPGGASVKAVSE